MVCDYLDEGPGPVCRARREREIVVPTIMEEVRYCLTDRFCECVHWRRRLEAAPAEARRARAGRAGTGRGPAYAAGL